MNILGIDLGSTQTCAILANKDESGLKIIGFGKSKTQGIKKGAITNIELASRSIQEAVANAQMMSGVHYDRVIVSISGAYAKSVDSIGVANVPEDEIGIKEIHRAVSTARHNAEIPTGYQIIHILPVNFKVNDQYVDDPLGMSGNRLEVSTHIIISQEVHIKNLKKAVELADLRVDNLVLSGYASAIACLDESEKELGAILIDMGGAICDVVIHMGNSIRYNSFLQVGSVNITQDLSIALHTPLKAAEKMKIDYAKFGDQNTIIQVPVIGDEKKLNEVSLEVVSKVIYARAEETLMILSKILSENKLAELIGAGIVLTGGMTKLAGLNELAPSTFDNKSVRIASARKDLIIGFDEIFSDPENSCAVGLCLYGAGHFTPYEVDSNEKLRYKGEAESTSKKPSFLDTHNEKAAKNNENSLNNDIIQHEEHEELDFEVPTKEAKPSVFSKIWQFIINKF